MKETLGDVKRIQSEGKAIEIYCDNGKVRITVVGPKIARIQITKSDVYRQFKSFSVEDPLPIGEFAIQHDEITRITTGELVIEIRKKPFNLTVLDNAQNTIQEDSRLEGVCWEGKSFVLKKLMKKNTCFYGMGEKAHGLNKRGKRYVMWNTDNPEYDSKSDPLYQSIPFFIVLNDSVAHGVFLDNTFKTWFDFGKSESHEYSFGAPDGPIDYYIIHGPSMREVIEGYTRITGRPHFIPKWALGHQHSRWMEYESPKDILQIARGFRENKIPCDTMVLDILYMDQFKIFTWDPEIFPTPRKLTDNLFEMGFKTMTIIDPGVKKEEGYFVFDEGLENDCFLKKEDGSLYLGLVWPGLTVFPAFSRPEVRSWFASYYMKQPEWGVSNSSWLDMNEPSIHEGFQDEFSVSEVVTKDGASWEKRLRNVYGFCMAKAAYSGLKQAYPGQRPFLLTRSGFAGYQRYSATWTGDNVSTWEYIKLSIPMILNLGLSGIPFSGADIGGFDGDASPELLARWYQLGSLYPFSRNHSQIETKRQEPWLFGSDVLQIARDYLSLRYQFMRYLYSLAWSASETGIPVMRPLVLEFQEDANTHEIDTQFLIGPFLLIAPVLEEGKNNRNVYLPEGCWFDYWTGERYEGPVSIEASAPLSKMPIYCRGGSVIPTGNIVQNTQEPQSDIVLLIYPDGNGDFILYEDDGISENGPYAKTEFHVEANDESILLEIDERDGTWISPANMLILEIRELARAPKRISIDRKELNVPVVYDSDNGLCRIEIENDGQSHKMLIDR